MIVGHHMKNMEEKGEAAGMYRLEDGRMIPDDFSHEQSLVFETERGLVVFNSCSHGGADVIIREIAMTYPGKKIYALIGGLHLFRSSVGEVRKLAEEIERTGIEKIYTGHCTGDEAFGILKEILKDRAEQFYTGMEIII